MGERRRRSPEAARRAILEAAERRLLEDGPEGVKVQRIAADLGITDAAVHYHFGSREALLSSLLRWIGRRLVDDVAAACASWAPGEIDVAAIGDILRRALSDRRGAQLAFWLSFSGWRSGGSGMLGPLVDRIHAARIKAAQLAGRPPPAIADTQYAIALFWAAHLQSAAFGETLLDTVRDDLQSLSPTDFTEFATGLIARHLAG
jgi:AcrR family transcriptional regulator